MPSRQEQYVGVAALTMVRTSTGRSIYVYRGQPVPGDATELDRLVTEGYIEPIDHDGFASTAQVTVGTVGGVITTDPGTQNVTGLAGGPTGVTEPKTIVESPPAKSASKADWVTYATSPEGGMTAEDAEKMTRDDLAAKYNPS